MFVTRACRVSTIFPSANVSRDKCSSVHGRLLLLKIYLGGEEEKFANLLSAHIVIKIKGILSQGISIYVRYGSGSRKGAAEICISSSRVVRNSRTAQRNNCAIN